MATKGNGNKRDLLSLKPAYIANGVYNSYWYNCICGLVENPDKPFYDYEIIGYYSEMHLKTKFPAKIELLNEEDSEQPIHDLNGCFTYLIDKVKKDLDRDYKKKLFENPLVNGDSKTKSAMIVKNEEVIYFTEEEYDREIQNLEQTATKEIRISKLSILKTLAASKLLMPESQKKITESKRTIVSIKE